jgi:hypothetical protein
MSYTNISIITDGNSSLQILKGVDEISGGVFMLLAMIVFIALLVVNFSSKAGFLPGLILSLFIGVIMTGLFWIAGLTAKFVLVAVLIVLFIAILLYLLIK